ncbi:MAG: 2-amino-4-hydroxy-6-hydroxymethyldihydropteridine diphosphokinase, partial [Pseudomonadota bacterium]
IGELPDTRLVAVSPLYKTPPWGITTQNWFLNACVAIETRLSPHALLRTVIAIEKDAGRVRDMRWGPRTLDIDVLTYGNLALMTPDLTIPHARMLERAFVMVPLADIAPDLRIGDMTAEAIAQTLDTEGMEPVGAAWNQAVT